MAPPARLSEAAEAWSAAQESTNIAVLEAYILRYKDTFYAEMAQARIEELKKQQIAVATPHLFPRLHPKPTPQSV